MKAAATLLLLLSSITFAAEPYTVEPNVVYGMYSGTALLMDVYKPAAPKGAGVIHVSGSGWTSPLAYNAGQLKLADQSLLYAKLSATKGTEMTTGPACPLSPSHSPMQC